MKKSKRQILHVSIDVSRLPAKAADAYLKKAMKRIARVVGKKYNVLVTPEDFRFQIL